jgi:hypothetical protein
MDREDRVGKRLNKKYIHNGRLGMSKRCIFYLICLSVAKSH